MVNDYLIVLFKNKERYKIIKNYKKYKNALTQFNLQVDRMSDVVFDVQTENGKDVKYEIALLEKTSEKLLPIYLTDELGRNQSVQVDDPNYSIIKISDYKISEKLHNIRTNERIDTNDVISKYLKTDSLKLISKLNNKIIIQDDDVFNLFSLKSVYDAERFLNCIESYLINNNKRNCMVVKDSSPEQKKYLYEVLSKQGFNKGMLYRKSTTHLKDK
jgi:hypothetical protein